MYLVYLPTYTQQQQPRRRIIVTKSNWNNSIGWINGEQSAGNERFNLHRRILESDRTRRSSPCQYNSGCASLSSFHLFIGTYLSASLHFSSIGKSIRRGGGGAMVVVIITVHLSFQYARQIPVTIPTSPHFRCLSISLHAHTPHSHRLSSPSPTICWLQFFSVDCIGTLCLLPCCGHDFPPLHRSIPIDPTCTREGGNPSRKRKELHRSNWLETDFNIIVCKTCCCAFLGSSSSTTNEGWDEVRRRYKDLYGYCCHPFIHSSKAEAELRVISCELPMMSPLHHQGINW